MKVMTDSESARRDESIGVSFDYLRRKMSEETTEWPLVAWTTLHKIPFSTDPKSKVSSRYIIFLINYSILKVESYFLDTLYLYCAVATLVITKLENSTKKKI